MALTSIVIPTHNRASLLPRAIESAKAAGSDIEIVVVDDASRDETPSLCRGMAGIHYVRLDRNVGLAQARNEGIARSRGEFVAFLDDDDLRLPGSLDEQAALLVDDPALGFVYGQVLLGDANCAPSGEVMPGHCSTGDIFWRLLDGNFFYVPSVVVRKRCLEAVGLFDRSLRATEDWDAWLRLASVYPVGAVPKPVGIYRDPTTASPTASGQMSSNRPKMVRASHQTFRKAMRLPRAQAADTQTRKRVQSDHERGMWESLVKEGRRALSQGRLRYAALNFATAVRLVPLRAVRPRVITNFLFDLARAGHS
jgi:hypothetical protein